MTPQEIFDTVSYHLFKQGKRAVDSHFCRYFNKIDGLKCAVGILIPDNVYFSEIDQGNQTIRNLINKYKNKFPDWMIENVALISELQSVHDKQFNWEKSANMLKALKDVADRYKLSTLKLDNLSFNQQTIEAISTD